MSLAHVPQSADKDAHGRFVGPIFFSDLRNSTGEEKKG